MANAAWVPMPIMIDYPKSPPERLSHYTNQKGLLGILQTRKLCFQYSFLNDHREYCLEWTWC